MYTEEYTKVLAYLNDTLNMIKGDVSYYEAKGIAEDRLTPRIGYRQHY